MSAQESPGRPSNLGEVTRLDWILLGVVAVAAIVGLRRGLVASLLAIAGIVLGAVIGAHLAKVVLPGGSHSPYAPLVGLGGAVVGAMVLETLGSMVGSLFRSGLRFPPFRALDSAGGLVLGAAAGLALVWVFGATALLLPGQPSLRHDVQRSALLRQLNSIVPSDRLLHALARVDPFPTIAGPEIPAGPLDGPIAKRPSRPSGDPQRRARPRVRLRTGHLRQRLGRRAGARRHRRARRRRRALDVGRAAGIRAAAARPT